jgi:hypothetical protein
VSFDEAMAPTEKSADDSQSALDLMPSLAFAAARQRPRSQSVRPCSRRHTARTHTVDIRVSGTHEPLAVTTMR